MLVPLPAHHRSVPRHTADRQRQVIRGLCNARFTFVIVGVQFPASCSSVVIIVRVNRLFTLCAPNDLLVKNQENEVFVLFVHE